MEAVQAAPPAELTDEMREYYMRERQALIMRLGALEVLLGLERSIIPRRKRKFITDPVADYVGDTDTR